jgi:transposase
MKKMFEYDLVRRMYYRENLSKREISRCTGYHRRTINRMLQYSAPPGYRLNKPRPKNKLGSFIPIIDQILEEDRQAPKKQRHTVQRIFDRLKAEHGFTGSYTIVKDYVRDKKIRLREVFFPLKQEAGTSQIDFGQAKVIIAGVKQKTHLFCMALPYSDAMFLKAYPTEGFEAVADGHISAYKFFQGVPPEHLYDNMSTVVKSFCRGLGRELTESFLALRSHYLFRSHLCNVGRANEKGVVENLIGYARRNFLVPILSFPSWEAFNNYLEAQCQKRLLMKASGKDKTIGALLEEEQASFLPLPASEFEACRKESRRVSSLSLVRFKNNSYSVPVEYAYREVIIKAYVFQLKICHKDSVIATHQRSYLRNDFVFDPIHYLPLLQRKPGALEGARPFSDWELPKSFETLKRFLQAKSGNGGKREYIQVLQLLRDFSVSEVHHAIEKAFAHSCVKFEAIRMLALSGKEPAMTVVHLSSEKLQALPRVRVKQIDTACYTALMQGDVL